MTLEILSTSIFYVRCGHDLTELETATPEQPPEDLSFDEKKVLGDGIQKFLDYAIELKEKQSDMFHQIISDYESSTQIRDL